MTTIANNNPAEWSVVTGETPTTLSVAWKAHKERVGVIAFYQDRKGTPWREFSNWYTHKHHGFTFILPQQLLDLAGIPQENRNDMFPPVVDNCQHSEKALMLCKAAAMGDSAQYIAIAAEASAAKCKRMGSNITSWDEDRWQHIICGVAFCILRQKFAVPALRAVLLDTGDKFLAEATAHDHTWAIGISIKMPTIYAVPAKWKGSNVLGWALMQVRAMIRQEMEAMQESY